MHSDCAMWALVHSNESLSITASGNYKRTRGWTEVATRGIGGDEIIVSIEKELVCYLQSTVISSISFTRMALWRSKIRQLHTITRLATAPN